MSIRSLAAMTCVMFMGAFAGGCSDACDEAGDKFAECFPNNGDNPPPSPTSNGDTQAPECSGANECAANCMNSATCSEIKAAFAAEENSYTRCMAGCR